jgi:predicted metal-dependent peptidase
MSNGTIDDHSPWKEFKALSNAEKELVQQQVDGIVKAAAEQTVKQRGTIPAHLKSRIDELLKVKPRIYDWKAQFRMQLGTELDLKYRKTHKRESRRFTDTPGIRFKKKVNILVGIDTSGSVSDKELADFFSEIHHINRAGARVHVVEYDAAIHGEWDFKVSKISISQQRWN